MRQLGSWVPNEADFTERITNVETKQSDFDVALESITSKVLNSEETLKENSEGVYELSTRVSEAEQKITSEAIVSTVRSSTSYTSDLNAKAETSQIISVINQSAEEILISADKINLSGYLTIASANSTYATQTNLATVENTADTANNTANTALSTANTANSRIATWCYNDDVTYINGGKIYTGTITAAQIATNAVTADKISVSNLESIVAKIGGWNISSIGIYSGTTSMASTAVGTFIGPTGFRQYASDSAYVNIQNGEITANGANISGTIDATTLTCENGTIAGWTINSDNLTSPVVTDELEMSNYSEINKAGFYNTYYNASNTYTWDLQIAYGAITILLYSPVNSICSITESQIAFECNSALSSVSQRNEEGLSITTDGRLHINSKYMPIIGASSGYSSTVCIGYTYSDSMAINTYWSDNSTHNLISRATDELTSYFGPGSIDSNAVKTNTNIRGYNVRLYTHGGGAYLGSSGSTAITSDRRMKKDIYAINDKYKNFFMKLEPVSYKYFNEENKGHRDHLGYIAQDVEQALYDSGLTTEEFAGLIIEHDVTLSSNYDSNLTDEENKANGIHYDTLYSLRNEEFISLNTVMIQDTIKRVDTVENILETTSARFSTYDSQIDILRNNTMNYRTNMLLWKANTISY